jgi:hypothetical protein
MDALAARMAPIIALMALAAVGLSGDPFHEPFHDTPRFTSTEVVYGVTSTDVTELPEYGVSP